MEHDSGLTRSRSSWIPDKHQDPQSVSLTRLVDSSQVDLSWNERWHLHWFRTCTSTQCSEYFEDDFWCGLVLRMCEAQAAVRHAAIAIGARHYQYEEAQRNQIPDRESLLTLSHSHKSITCLYQDLIRHESSRLHKETVLVTCIILTMLALFQEEFFAARCHFQSGFKLFKKWVAVDSEASPNGTMLKQAFSQVHLHFSTCMNPREFVKDERLIPLEIPKSSINIAPQTPDELAREARSTLAVGWQAVHSHPGGGFSIDSAGSPMYRGGYAILSKLQLWRSQLKHLLPHKPHPQRHRDLLTLLQMWTLVIDIKLDVAGSENPTESLYDNYLTSFEGAIALAKDLLRLGVTEVSAPLYYIKPSVVTALLWCATKCRDWRVRADVLSLLNECKHHDSWVSAATSAIERLIQIESDGVELGCAIPVAARVDCIIVKPLFDSSQVQLWYQKSQDKQDRNHQHALWQCDTLSC